MGVVTLKLYLDDSGEREQSVGGCIADVKSWESFESAWQTLLDDFHVDWFHAVDFEAHPRRGRKEHRKPGYGLMRDDERDEFRHGLGMVLQQHIGVTIADAVKGGGSRWGGYVCAIIPAGSVEMKKAMKANDRVNQRGKPQPKSGSERFVERTSSRWSMTPMAIASSRHFYWQRIRLPCRSRKLCSRSSQISLERTDWFRWRMQ